jgi:hypothetical protein
VVEEVCISLRAVEEVEERIGRWKTLQKMRAEDESMERYQTKLSELTCGIRDIRHDDNGTMECFYSSSLDIVVIE